MKNVKVTLICTCYDMNLLIKQYLAHMCNLLCTLEMREHTKLGAFILILKNYDFIAIVLVTAQDPQISLFDLKSASDFPLQLDILNMTHKALITNFIDIDRLILFIL